MATVTRTFLVDDLDGSADSVETVQFNADGVNLEIDLSPANATRLREKLARFVDAAHPVKPAKAPAPAKRGKATVVATNKVNVQEIRQWAAQAGLQVSSRGRLSADLVEKFNAAH